MRLCISNLSECEKRCHHFYTHFIGVCLLTFHLRLKEFVPYTHAMSLFHPKTKIKNNQFIINKPWKGNRRQAEKRVMTTFNKVIEQRDIQGTANKKWVLSFDSVSLSILFALTQLNFLWQKNLFIRKHRYTHVHIFCILRLYNHLPS